MYGCQTIEVVIVFTIDTTSVNDMTSDMGHDGSNSQNDDTDAGLIESVLDKIAEERFFYDMGEGG